MRIPYSIEGFEATGWQVRVRDGDRTTTLDLPQQPLLATPGPGMLRWSPINDHGVPGIAAPWRDGQYKILRVSPRTCGLFFERTSGGFDPIALGAPEELKARAWSLRRASDFVFYRTGAV